MQRCVRDEGTEGGELVGLFGAGVLDGEFGGVPFRGVLLPFLERLRFAIREV